MSSPSYFVLFIFVYFISYNTFAVNLKRFEGLIVNGTRLNQNNIEDLPLNISIITAEEIKLSSAQTLPELLSQEPGIQKSSQFGNHAVRSDIDIRGVWSKRHSKYVNFIGWQTS